MRVLEVRNVIKDYRRGTELVRALDGVSFGIDAGSLVSIMGPSGSGKSTLLHLLGGLDTPTSGAVVADGHDLATLDDEALTTFRRRRLGFVFQFFNLLPNLTAWENVALPRLLDGQGLAKQRPRAVELLERVGLGHRVEHKPTEMSGGQLQRVAIARALINDPILILADEPTGNLDSHTGEEVLTLLRDLTRAEGRTMVMVTHDPKAAAVGDRVIRLADGRLADATDATGGDGDAVTDGDTVAGPATVDLTAAADAEVEVP